MTRSISMADNEASSGAPEKRLPPGKVKIMEALKVLLEQKEFASITTSELAATAGVTEGLIYKVLQGQTRRAACSPFGLRGLVSYSTGNGTSRHRGNFEQALQTYPDPPNHVRP